MQKKKKKKKLCLKIALRWETTTTNKNNYRQLKVGDCMTNIPPESHVLLHFEMVLKSASGEVISQASPSSHSRTDSTKSKVFTWTWQWIRTVPQLCLSHKSGDNKYTTHCPETDLPARTGCRGARGQSRRWASSGRWGSGDWPHCRTWSEPPTAAAAGCSGCRAKEDWKKT